MALLPASCFELDSEDFLLSPPLSLAGLPSENMFETFVTKTKIIWFVVNFCESENFTLGTY